MAGHLSSSLRLGGGEHPRRRSPSIGYPSAHHKHLKSTNLLERLNEEIKRRTRVVRIFANQESCFRLIRALAVETHEGRLEEHRYLNTDLLVEHKRELLRQLE